MTNQRLKDRVILVTGASSGIGREVASHFVTEGATVLLHGKNERALNTLYDELLPTAAEKPVIVPFDLKSAPLMVYEELNEYVMSTFGRLDGLVHNAAYLGSVTPIEHYPLEQWQDVLQVNLTAPLVLTKALLPSLKASNDASIIFTTATEGKAPKSAYWGAYGVSKQAIVALANTLAAEFETNTNIRVNTINPVCVRTNLRAKIYPGEPPFDNPDPKTLLPTYLYLIGPESKGTTGQLFEKD